MRKLLFIGLSLVAMHNLHAQQFKQISKVKLSEVVEVSQARWVDLNRDTLLDVVLTGKTPTGELKIFTFENLAGISLEERVAQATDILDGRFILTDHNKDNQTDLLLYGHNATSGLIKPFLNIGDFSLTGSDALLPVTTSKLAVVDFNRNGVAELITHEVLSGKSHIRIYKISNDTYTLHYDTIGITVSDLKVFDFNRDGFTDILLSGNNETNQPVVQLWLNQGGLKFKKVSVPSPVKGKLSLFDFNADGYFDVWAMGRDNNGDQVKVIWKNNAGELHVESLETDIEPIQIFSGDMNADGLADQWIFGKTGLDKINQIITATDSIQLDISGVLLIEPGDFNRDGNLDFLQVIDSAGGIWVKLYKNILEVKNQRPVPSALFESFGISVFSRTFIFWLPSSDDKTLSSSLTYDVWLGKGSESIFMSSFSLINGRRNIVDHGNAGTNTFKFFSGPATGKWWYIIQTVDNAYNGSYLDPILIPPGNGQPVTGVVTDCTEIVIEMVQACKNQQVILTTNYAAHWFSISGKYVGNFDTYTFTANKADTLFSFTPQMEDCSQHKVWIINVNEGFISESKTIYTCTGSTIELGIRTGWNEIKWFTQPEIVDQDTISILVNEPLILQVEAKATGCELRKTFTINLSLPELEIVTSQFQIQLGNSVQLEATSNAAIFQWSPITGLSDATILNPLATPPQTILYTLVVTDSLGCTNTDNVQVEVQQTGFIPDLFTPNRDGNNDVLLVYGLTQASSFRFRIFNREGSTVYQTENVIDAIATGWNGSTNGNEQPAGMYYWRVEGLLPDGEQVLLNGNRTGSVFLMR